VVDYFKKRKYKRIKKPFIVRFQKLTKDGKSGVFPGWDIVSVQDLGAGGVLFNYDDKFEMDSRLEFKINFPTLVEPIGCKGKVIRIEKEINSSRVRIASIFTDINEEEKNEINRFAEGLGPEDLVG